MSQGAESTSFLAAFMNYNRANTPMTSKPMGSLDSKVAADGLKTGSNSPKSCELKSKYKKEPDLASEKFTALRKFLNSPEKKLQQSKNWLVDFTIDNAEIRKHSYSRNMKDVKDQGSREHTSDAKTKTPVKPKMVPLKGSPKLDSRSVNMKDLQSSPSQNLRQRIQKDSKSQNNSPKTDLVRSIKFHKKENCGIRKPLRVLKRKRQPEPVESDMDSEDPEVSFKPKPKRRKVNLTDTYKMAPLTGSPLVTRSRKLANAVKGLQKTIKEKRELKKREKQTKQPGVKTKENSVKLSAKTQARLRMRKVKIERKRKYDAIRSSPRTKHSDTVNADTEAEGNLNIKKPRKQQLDSPSKRINHVIKKKGKLKSRNRQHNRDLKTESKILSSKVSNINSANRTSPRSKHEQTSIAPQPCQKVSPAKKVDMKTTPVKQEVQSSSPTKIMDKKLANERQLEASDKQKSLSFSALAGGSVSRPASYGVTSSPKVHGLPAVLSLNTLSGIPQQVQGSTFSSVQPGFGATASSVALLDKLYTTYKSKGTKRGRKRSTNPQGSYSSTSSHGTDTKVTDTKVMDDGKKKKFVCNICGNWYRYSAALRRHEETHKKKLMPFKCGVCKKKFPLKSSLMQHVRLHGTTKQEFKCPTCGQQFNNYGSYVRHCKIHTSERPHKCEICGKGFIEKFNLKHHLYIHTGEKPYKCDKCGVAYNHRSPLNRHQQREHPGSQSLPATPTPSTSDMGFFRPSPRPNSLSINSNSNSTTTQGINNSSIQSALSNSSLNVNANSCDDQGDNSPPFTKLKTKRTLAETVDMLRHTSNLNGMSVLKNNSLKKKTLTPSDDQSRSSSRNSSRSNSPNITPIKSEVLTPSCTPCSTPKKSPSCSPSPSLNQVPVVRTKRDTYLFRKGDKVVAQWHDGLYYLGVILKIDEKSRRCLLQYEDNSKYWSLFKDIHRGSKDGEMICCVCMGENSEKPNEIVLCDNCGQGYHQNCHTPVVRGSEILDPDDEWCCRKCIFALTMKAGGALKTGKYADELRKMKLTFPYDLSSLCWDAQHKTNTEQYYCYCGGPGVWYQKMLQCCRCKQWFHEACIQCLQYPLLYADSFYIFVCSSCNFGQEYIKRLSIDWPDLVHITIFNMSMENNLKYYELDVDIMVWINDNWDVLQVSEYNDLDEAERREEVREALVKNKARFKNGNENRKRYTLWGLRVRVPPPRTHITLPLDGLVDDKVMKDLKVKGRRSKVFMPVACNTPVTMRHSPLQLKGAARRRMLQNSQLLTNNAQQYGKEIAESPVCLQNGERIPEPPVVKQSEKPGPLLDRLIPPLNSYAGHNHPFKHEIEQTLEKIETEQRAAIWSYFTSEDEQDNDNISVSPEGPPVLIKEEPVDSFVAGGDMSPPLSETSDLTYRRNRRSKSNTPKLISAEGLKRSRRISNQKLSRNTPPELEQTVPVKQQISVQKVRSAKANYLCAFDKLGYGKGMYVQGKREAADGKLDYLISWQ